MIVDDPDAPNPAAPKRTWVHWALYNLPPSINCIPEGMEASQLPSGTMQGINDWSRTGYSGPCPPVGSHRYFHKLYALNIVLPDVKKSTKAIVEKSMQDHVIAQTELIGRYQKR